MVEITLQLLQEYGAMNNDTKKLEYIAIDTLEYIELLILATKEVIIGRRYY